MKLVSFIGETGQTHVGVVRGDYIVDLSAWWSSDAPFSHLDMISLIAMGQEGLDRVSQAFGTEERVLQERGALVPWDESKLLAPIPRPRKNVLCLGRNYAEHAAESSRAFGDAPSTTPHNEAPQYPAIFTKAPTTVIGPYSDIPYDPQVSEQIDWEGELAIVIGQAGKNIRREDAMSHIFGYMALNDVSARDIQKRHGGQFFKGKSLDGSCPMGPWIVTADELPDPSNLQIWTRVNGVEKQHDTTRSMLIDVPGIIEGMSWGMTLEPGDIIGTGTPAGVGFARTPPEFLRPGDVVECEIEGIGVIKNNVRGT